MRVKHLAIVVALALAAACDSTGSSTIGVSGFGGTGGATHLAFTVQPTNTSPGTAIVPAVQVTAATSSGSVDPAFSNSVIVSIGTNPGGGGLSGTRTVTAVAGVATFSNLSITNAGKRLQLTAAASNLNSRQRPSTSSPGSSARRLDRNPTALVGAPDVWQFAYREHFPA
jgi:hypothetical protein